MSPVNFIKCPFICNCRCPLFIMIIRRCIFDCRVMEPLDPSASLWHLEKLAGSNTHIRIRSANSGEYLYAETDELARDPERRRVFTWASVLPYPDSSPRYWEVSEVNSCFTLKNFHYNEYLYAAADDLALADDKRSIFTWKNYNTLGTEGFWSFNKDIIGISYQVVVSDHLHHLQWRIFIIATFKSHGIL